LRATVREPEAFLHRDGEISEQETAPFAVVYEKLNDLGEHPVEGQNSGDYFGTCAGVG
jgi:hypothetical protein